MPKAKTMMVRILIDSTVDEILLVEAVRDALTNLAVRTWVAVDHPQPQHAAQLWAAILSGVDPHGAGSARVRDGGS